MSTLVCWPFEASCSNSSNFWGWEAQLLQLTWARALQHLYWPKPVLELTLPAKDRLFLITRMYPESLSDQTDWSEVQLLQRWTPQSTSFLSADTLLNFPWKRGWVSTSKPVRSLMASLILEVRNTWTRRKQNFVFLKHNKRKVWEKRLSVPLLLQDVPLSLKLNLQASSIIPILNL